MKPTAGLLGLGAIIAILLASFYAYSNLSRERSNSPSAQTAPVSDLGSKEELARPNEQVAIFSKPSTTANVPQLDGLNEAQIQKGLENLEDNLDLLRHPLE